MNTISKKISLFLAVLIQLNAMVGAGILTIPAFLIPEAGAGGLISCFLGMGIALAIALSLGRLSILYPGSGWSYRFPALWVDSSITTAKFIHSHFGCFNIPRLDRGRSSLNRAIFDFSSGYLLARNNNDGLF